uniref:Innexin n=1 Tax=Panagrolaimus davidi TaxID=227884 RepID=A0A914P4R1_9BILA
MPIFAFQSLLKRTTKPGFDEDFVDRLNSSYAAYFFIAVSITIFGYNFGQKPIQCLPKPSWHYSWTQYATDICFIEGMYFVPLNVSLPAENGYKDLKKISFYQWTPFVLILLGIMFTFPRSLWSFVQWSSNFCMTVILFEGKKTKNSPLRTKYFVKVSTEHMYEMML